MTRFASSSSLRLWNHGCVIEDCFSFPFRELFKCFKYFCQFIKNQNKITFGESLKNFVEIFPIQLNNF